MSSTLPPTLLLEEVNCPLCGAADCSPFLKGRDNLHDLPGEFQLVRCRACRHVYMNPRPTLEAIPLCYPADYGPHQTESSPENAAASSPAAPASGNPWYLSRWARMIPGLRRLYYWLADSKSEFFPLVKTTPRRALEIGCAHGRFLSKLRDAGWEVKGVEPAGAAAELARRQGFDVHAGTLESAEHSDESFDAVFAWMVIEHLPDPVGTLREIHCVLKPGGWLTFSVPNFACWERHVFGRCWHGMELPRHLQHFTPRTLRALLERTGFTETQVIHQRNLLNMWMNGGILLKRWFPRSAAGQRLIDAADRPGMWSQLLVAPAAKLLAFLHQGGRLTVIARRPTASADAAKSRP